MLFLRTLSSKNRLKDWNKLIYLCILLISIDQCSSNSVTSNIPPRSTNNLKNPENDFIEKKSVPTIESVNDFERMYKNHFHDNDTVALLLDFDGTLAPITPHPNDTVMPNNTSEVFHRLCNQTKVFVAIISGRGLSDVRSKVNTPGIVYAGNHGLEIVYKDGHKYDHFIPNDLKENFTKMITQLKNEIEGDGCWIENKVQSVTVHYLEAPEANHEYILEKGSEIVSYYGYVPHRAYKAIEVKPPVQWNKGNAAALILESYFGKNWDDHVKAVFAGDDTTDEDVMLKLHGKGISFRVSKNPDVLTYANYRLPSTESIHQMLKWIETYYH